LTNPLAVVIANILGADWAWDFIDQYAFWIELISAILGVLAFLGWIIGFRPRATCTSYGTFLDCKTDKVLEEMSLNINWGRVFFLRKMKLRRIDRNADFRILCKPLGKVKEPLPMANYGDKSASEKGRDVYLMNKTFFKKEEIVDVYLETTRPAPADYKSKIEIKKGQARIVVLNQNNIELRNLPIELPETITLEKMLGYSNFFKNWNSDPDMGITGFLSTVPACVGGEPGKVTIPLN